MIRTTTIRSLARWIVGLFVVVQIFAVAPLISEHTAHVAQSELGLSESYDTTAHIPSGTHHRGDADGAVQHHEVQDLSGALSCTVHACETSLVHAAIPSRESAVLA